MVLVQKIRFRTILSGLLVATIFMNGCAIASKNATSEKKSKTQLLENITNEISIKTIPPSEVVRSKIDQFKKTLNKKYFTEQDWKLHDELLEYYSELKNRKATKVTIPGKTKVVMPIETYCLNPDRAIPNSKEVYSWRKSSPRIKYFSELLDLRRNGKIGQDELQGLIWNLKNETRWEEYPNRQKSILQKIDPNASINLPSSLKDKGIDLVKDQLFSFSGIGGAFNSYELIKGKYYELSDIKKNIGGLTSNYDLEDHDNLTKIPGTDIYSQSESQGYNGQEVTFYNPTDRDQELDLTQYYLEPERDDVQRIGINPKIPEDPDLLSDLEKLLYESMLRIGVGFTPGINDVADLYELFTGKDFLTGKGLSIDEQLASAVGVVLGSGSLYRQVKRWVNAPIEYLPKFESVLSKAANKGVIKPKYAVVRNILDDSTISAKNLSKELDHNGTKEISQFLRNNSVLREDRIKTIRSFEHGSIRRRVVESDEIVYRWHNNDKNALQFGRYVSPERIENASLARSKLALPDQNQMKHLDAFTLKKGTTVFEGRIAPYSDQHGGGRQILVPGDLKNSLKFKERIK
jgi:hypothetical protein